LTAAAFQPSLYASFSAGVDNDLGGFGSSVTMCASHFAADGCMLIIKTYQVDRKSMNSDTHETAEAVAKEAGAIIPCPVCGCYDIGADDEDANKLAYAMAENRRKSGDRGFRGMSHKEAMAVIKSVIDDANYECPGCHSPGRD
jgi:hypothetical protein